MESDDAYARALEQASGSGHPGTVGVLMCAGDADAAFVDGIASRCKAVCRAQDLDALLEHGARVDLAVLTRDWLAGSDADTATSALVRLRDLHAGAVLAAADKRAPLPPKRWRELGYVARSRGQGVTLYGFNLYDYKRRPEWLNARYWANPELWDVYRW